MKKLEYENDNYIDPLEEATTIINTRENINIAVKELNKKIIYQCLFYEKQQKNDKKFFLQNFSEFAKQRLLNYFNMLIYDMDFEKIKTNFLENIHEYYLNEEETVCDYAQILINLIKTNSIKENNGTEFLQELQDIPRILKNIFNYNPNVNSIEKYTIYTKNYIESLQVITNVITFFASKDNKNV